jgi:hypothetical protein
LGSGVDSRYDIKKNFKIKEWKLDLGRLYVISRDYKGKRESYIDNYIHKRTILLKVDIIVMVVPSKSTEVLPRLYAQLALDTRKLLTE